LLTIARSPLRVSFFGGGTDYPDYFKQFPGAVLGTAINKYIYTVTLPMAGVAQTKYRITYRKVETVDTIDEIEHNVIRETLRELKYDDSLNIAIISDIPGNSGLGSSSSFTVGFVKLIEHLKGHSITKFDLMNKAVHVERNLLNENVGIQDQIHATFGGLNLYSFHKDSFAIRPVRMTTDCRVAFDRSLCLVYSGIQRSASVILEEQISRTKENKIHKELGHLLKLCEEGISILEGTDPDTMLKDFGRLVSEGWETKKTLSTAITNAGIDEIYDTAMKSGAYGGKLCGAGGGGFLMFLAPAHTQRIIQDKFGKSAFIKIAMEDDGARIIKT
jgi:D-glycero-alpha-D-manno-heptose-7-phosphate kinase